MAKSAIDHSGRFSLRMATRSPLRMPQFLQRADGSGDVAAEVRGGDGQPLSRLAVEHGAVEIALGGCEENVVQRGKAHWGSERF